MTALTNSTATWGIPYAIPATALCDGYDAVAQMAQAVNDTLSEFFADLDRVLTIPYASIGATTDQTVKTNVPGFAAPVLVIDYDTVNADTENMTNIATLPSIITLPANVSNTGGCYALFNQVIGFTGNTVNTGVVEPFIAINSALPDPGGINFADDVNVNVGGTFASLIQVPAAGGDLQVVGEMGAANAGQPFATMTSSTFFALWVSDL